MSPTQPPFRLNLVQGSVSIAFSAEAARELRQAIATLTESLKANAVKPSSSRTKPKPPLEYKYQGEVFLEVFCNPNIYPSPFAAKVLLTVRDERIRLNAEAELTRLVEDIGQYLEQVS